MKIYPLNLMMNLLRNFLVLTIILLGGCSQLKTREEIQDSMIESQARSHPHRVRTAPANREVVTPPLTSEENPKNFNPINNIPDPINTNLITPPPVSLPPVKSPKVGLILGPGGVKAFAHIGVLQELQKERVPIVSIVGIETGAIPAALFANKGLSNDVEWQMFKLKEHELVGKAGLLDKDSLQKVEALAPFLEESLRDFQSENGKIKFACPAFNMSKKQTFWMARGAYSQLVPFCVPSKPLFASYKDNVAMTWDPLAAKKQLKSMGANYIIYVNVLNQSSRERGYFSDKESLENIWWTMVADQISKNKEEFDFVFQIDTQDVGLNEFDKKSEAIQKGTEGTREQIGMLLKKLGI
jgi:predicted acylesterase/phospholipase RssA